MSLIGAVLMALQGVWARPVIEGPDADGADNPAGKAVDNVLRRATVESHDENCELRARLRAADEQYSELCEESRALARQRDNWKARFDQLAHDLQPYRQTLGETRAQNAYNQNAYNQQAQAQMLTQQLPAQPRQQQALENAIDLAPYLQEGLGPFGRLRRVDPRRVDPRRVDPRQRRCNCTPGRAGFLTPVGPWP